MEALRLNVELLYCSMSLARFTTWPTCELSRRLVLSIVAAWRRLPSLAIRPKLTMWFSRQMKIFFYRTKIFLSNENLINQDFFLQMKYILSNKNVSHRIKIFLLNFAPFRRPFVLDNSFRLLVPWTLLDLWRFFNHFVSIQTTSVVKGIKCK